MVDSKGGGNGNAVVVNGNKVDTRWLKVSHWMLYLFAAFIWGIGSFACGDQGVQLINESQTMSGDSLPYSDVIITLVVSCVGGALLGYFFFVPLCNRNIDRLLELEFPKFYDSFRLRFYLLLCLFDGGVIILTSYFAKDATSKLVMGGVDLTVCCGLGLSFFVFPWRWRAFCRKVEQSGKGNVSSVKQNLLYNEEGEG